MWLVMEWCIRNADILDSSTPLRYAQNHYGLVKATSRGMKSAVSYVKGQGGFQTRPYDTTRRHGLFSGK